MNRLRKSVAALVIATGASGVWVGGSALVHNVAFAEQERKVETTRDQLATTNDLSAAFRNVGTVLEPSVVNIQVRKTVKGGAGGLPFNDDLLRRFFRDRNNNNENPDKDKDVDYKTHLNPKSLETLTGCLVEESLANVKPLDRVQFERLGYFCVDSDSTPAKLVFNRTISLRDSWVAQAGKTEE